MGKMATRLLLLLAASLLPTFVSANSVANVTIAEIAIDPGYGNWVFIRVSPAPTAANRPGCSTNGYWHFAFKFEGVAYREIYAALLAAQMAGKTVSITGADNCSIWSDVETVRGMNVQG